tara:strand:+ start:206 stop:547 length:342 start_codon:yes stop_codon:yes gene_type:complete
MSTESNQPPVYWPRVKEILDDVMHRWEERWGREGYPGIHEYYWETSQELKDSVLSGYRSIEPGVPGKDTWLVKSLARAVGTYGKMPLKGPFLTRAEVDEIITWIDTGMPEAPE